MRLKVYVSFQKAIRHWQLYMLLALPLAYLLLFHYVPMAGAQIAFRKYTPRLGIWRSQWVGLTYFRKFFESYQFERVIVNTLSLSIYAIFAGFPLPIVLAICLNTLPDTLYKRTVQMITYAPHSSPRRCWSACC